jgi:hypothetical protein
LAELPQSAGQSSGDRFGVARRNDFPQLMRANEVCEGTFGAQRETRAAQPHDLEDLGRVDSFGTLRVAQNAQRHMAPGELFDRPSVLDVTHAAHS